MAKVAFDGINKLIIVNNSETELDAKVNIYSEWKDWVSASVNSKYLQAVRVVGGDPTTGANAVAPYFFLTNGWKIRPYEGNHTLNITGNLFVDEPETYGYNLIVATQGYYQVLVNLSTTSDATLVTATANLSEQDIDTIATAVSEEVASTVATNVWAALLSENQDPYTVGKAIKDTLDEVRRSAKRNLAFKFIG